MLHLSVGIFVKTFSLAMTLSKWEKLEHEEKSKSKASPEYSSGLAAVSGYSYEDDLDGV